MFLPGEDMKQWPARCVMSVLATAWRGGCVGGGTVLLCVRCLDLQLGELLAELPGVGSDPADGIVAEVELL